MSIFTEILENTPQVSDLKKAIAGGEATMVTGLSEIHKTHLIAALVNETEKKKTAIVLTEDETSARRMSQDFNEISEFTGAVFPSREPVFKPLETVSADYEQLRMNVLSDLAAGKLSVVFVPVSAALSLLPPPKQVLSASFKLRTGEEIDQGKLIEQLLTGGYIRREQVEGSGQFSSRGGIVDVFPISSSYPVRIEFWGDEIDTLSLFDPESQRRTDSVEQIEINPASEALIKNEVLKERIQIYRKEREHQLSQQAIDGLLRDEERLSSGSISNYDKYVSLIYEEAATLFDYLPNSLLFVSENAAVREAGYEADRQWERDLSLLIEEGELTTDLKGIRLPFSELWNQVIGRGVLLESFLREVPTASFLHVITINSVSLSCWNGEFEVLREQLAEYRQTGTTVLILSGTQQATSSLLSDLQEDGISVAEGRMNTHPAPGGVYLIPGSLSAGMEYPQFSFAVITRAPQSKGTRKCPRKKRGTTIKSLSDLHQGDLVVHVSHGVGKFDGIVKLDAQGIEKDYIKIMYAGKDVLYVPVTQLDLVSRYIGNQSDRVRLNKLGGSEWKKTRLRAKKAVTEMAQELIRLYAEREKTEGFSFSPDNDWQRNFEEQFPYEETEDQLAATEEIKKDMESSRPMDRLLCGDVGYGKTEVALRAAFKCVLDGKQCVFLCPTTILAWQHYQNILSRLGDFPVETALLSRFRSTKEQQKVLTQLKKGQIDLLVGTHRIVQNDVCFHDLGLAIIDEEQRFGVKQKERFKELFRGVDMLTLSATPIPRTLNMAMSGIRDMSILEQPPKNRLPVQTCVMEYHPSVIAEAIRRELNRGGQVFYLHNWIDSIGQTAQRVKELVPEARIGVAHGRMQESELSNIWRQLLDHELDLLVCTTIIETGIDLSNCNTLIVEHADRIGLSQLYQLRGRVGRSNRRAYAYFTFRAGKILSETALKRLSAIREFTRFGSGFQIAMRDLEIRGAGNLLGQSQHGHMEAIGYDMYLRLLSDAVKEEKGETPAPSFEDCVIDIPLSAHIPEKYIENLSQRLEIYQKIAALRTEEDRLDLTDELIDRFGEPPAPVLGLMDISLLRVASVSMGFTEILEQAGELRFYLKTLETERLTGLIDLFGNRVRLNAGEKPYAAVRLSGEQPLDVLKKLLQTKK